MLPEPTRLERQREAFALLRENATRAHQEGDGLLASNLAETALHEISRLAKDGTLSLPLREVQWAVIFQMFWLLLKHSVTLTNDLVQKWLCSTEDDRQARDLLLAYIKLLSEPFLSSEQTLKLIDALPLSAFGAEPTPETVEIIRHLVELTWFHTVEDGQWKIICKKWSDGKVPWIKSALSGMEERLQIQSQLTCPSSKNAPLPESAATDLTGKLPLASLWLLHLYGRHTDVGKMVAAELARYNIDDYQWRLIADFGHTNFWAGGRGDSQGAWLARRRSMTLRFPVLVFHDRREVRINELLLGLFRSQKDAMGYERQEICQLAMLHEVAALRIWDYWMWSEAIRAQSQGSLEASRWVGDGQDFLAVNGLVQGVRCGFLDKQGSLVDKAIEKLEFAPSSILRFLADAALTTYPRKQHSTAALLVKIADLFPDDLWPRLAEWTLNYAKNFREKRLLGSKLNVLEHWLSLIPSLPATSPVWRLLQPEVLLIGRMGHAWRGGDLEDLLLFWLIFSPLDLALELGTTIASIPTSDLGEQLARASLFVDAERARPSFEGQFTSKLAAQPQDILVETILAAHSGGLLPEQTQRLRQEVGRRVDSFLMKAVPPPDTKEFQMMSWVPNFTVVPSWTEADLPLLEKLIGALNAPDILPAYVSNLLNMVQVMAAFGAPDISRRLVPEIERWMQELPEGWTKNTRSSNAFVLAHLNYGIQDVDRDIGWLVFQMVRKLDADGQALALLWTKKTLLAKTTSHLPIAFHQNLVVATKGDPLLAKQALHNLENILIRLCIHVADGQSEPMLGVLRYMADALRSTSSKSLDWTTETGATALQFLLSWCEDTLPQLSRQTDPNLRASIGTLLSTLEDRKTVPEGLVQVIERMYSDNRARVRFAVRGGWKTIRI